MLTIFYDGNCSLCCAEMNHLKQLDTNEQINLVDLHDAEALGGYPQIEFTRGMALLHGIYNGQLLIGLEVTHRAWNIVGKGIWVAPMGWPVIRTILGWCYIFFARYRQPISRTLCKIFRIKKSSCLSGICHEK